MIAGIDFSYGAAGVTPEWCAAQLAAGIQIAVADLWTGRETIPAARQALRHWREAGGKTGAYFVVHDHRPVGEHFGQAREVAGDEWEHLERVAIDVEIALTSVETVLAAADAVIAEGGSPIVYTSYSKWLALTDNSEACAHLPLWDASHGIPPSLTPYRSYGGWGSALIGHQHSNTTPLDGVLVDFNVFAPEFVRVREQPSPLAVALAHLAEADKHNAAATVSTREAAWHLRAARELLTGA